MKIITIITGRINGINMKEMIIITIEEEEVKIKEEIIEVIITNIIIMIFMKIIIITIKAIKIAIMNKKTILIIITIITKN